jgi:hypothetical protein
VLAIGADTTDSVSTPGTCSVSIGRVKRMLEHFYDISLIAIDAPQSLPFQSQE